MTQKDTVPKLFDEIRKRISISLFSYSIFGYFDADLLNVDRNFIAIRIRFHFQWVTYIQTTVYYRHVNLIPDDFVMVCTNSKFGSIGLVIRLMLKSQT